MCFYPCTIYYSYFHCVSGWRRLPWCQKHHWGYTSYWALFTLCSLCPPTSQTPVKYSSVFGISHSSRLKQSQLSFPPPNCVPVLKRRQPPALVLSGMKRGHRSCKAAQTCEMGFTRCSATSGVAMYDSVCAESRKGKAFKATPAITSYKP